jgi:hypothetical protein
MTDNAKVSHRYRELGAQEPPRALDDAILAAARQSARPWTKRWAVPLSLAAVIVLSVTVTLRIQHERPGIESPAPKAAAPRAAESSAPLVESQLERKAEAQPESATRKNAKEVAKAAAADEVARARGEIKERPTPSVAAAPAASEPKPFAADPSASSTSGRVEESRVAASGVTGKLAPQAGPVRALAKRAEAQAKVQALKDADAPERELERIADLRRQEKHEEADRALAEFRKHYPEFRIPNAMLERIERR